MIRKKLLFLFFLALAPVALRAQVVPAANGHTSSLSVGAGLNVWDTDYVDNKQYGVTIYGDYDFWKKWFGVEGYYRTVSLNKQNGQVSYKNFAGGPRFIYRHNKFEPYAKFVYGYGSINFNEIVGFPGYNHDSYPYYAFGGGLDYKVSPRWKVRVDYEYQWWKDVFTQNGTLTPNGLTVGASYRIF